MSNWTHVCGMVRFDDLGGIVGKDCFTDKNLEDVFGRIKLWEDFGKDDEDKDVSHCPMGSEGSLEYTLYRDKKAIENSCICNTYLMIHGDLRDYDTPEDVIEWFKKAVKKCKKKNLFVRDAVISAYDEWGRKPYTWCKQEDECE